MTLPIKSKRLYITEFNESMAESVHINSLDEDNRRFVPDEVFETIEDARETISALISFYKKEDAPLVYPIFLNTGQHIGHVQAVPIPDGWEIGYHVAKPYCGNGYATEAIDAFLPPIMRKLDITKITGICHADNIASRRVLEKCGFFLEFEGVGEYHGEEQRICRYKHFNEFTTLERMDEFFNIRANLYDRHMIDDLDLGGFYEAIADCFDTPVNRLLGLGCGTGLEFKLLFERYPDMEVTGIDLAIAMLQKLEEKYPDKNIRLICGSFFDVDFDGSYDHVLSTYSFHHFSENSKLDLYKKIHAALTSDGRFIFGDYTVPTMERQQELLAENEEKRREQGASAGEFYHFDTPFTAETEVKLMKTAGFSTVDVVRQWESASIIIAGV